MSGGSVHHLYTMVTKDQLRAVDGDLDMSFVVKVSRIIPTRKKRFFEAPLGYTEFLAAHRSNWQEGPETPV